MTHQIGDERDYPVIDRVHDDESDQPQLVDRDPDGTEGDPDTEAEYHAHRADDGTTILPVDDPAFVADADRDTADDPGDADLDADGVPDQFEDGPDADTRTDVLDGTADADGGDAPAHRADAPVDAVPGEADPAGPGDPLPGDGLGSGDGRADDATVVAVDDVAAQDPGVIVVPPVTDDADRVPATSDDVAAGTSTDTATDTATDTSADTSAPDVTPDDAAEDRWRDLQITFVDDPASAVRDAAELLEQAVADLRQRFEGSDSTEDLRTAFRKYRDVYRSLQ
jgi:hypothetical protein